MMGATSRSPNRALRRIPWRAVLAALAAASLAYMYLNQRDDASVVDVEVAEVARGALRVSFTADGVVRARTVDLSPRAPARIAAVLAVEGQTVRRGDALVRFDDEQARAISREADAAAVAARAAVRQAEAAVALARRQAAAAEAQALAAVREAEAMLRQVQAGARESEIAQAQERANAGRAQLAAAETSLRRVRELYAAGAVARADLDAAEARVEASAAEHRAALETVALLRGGAHAEEKAAAQSRVDAANAALARARTGSEEVRAREAEHAAALARSTQAGAAAAAARAALSETRLTAPFAGVVSRVPAEIGQVAAPGTPVVSLMDPRDTWIRADVTGEDAAKIRVGQSVVVTAASHPGRRFRALIAEIAPEAETKPDAALRTRILRARIRLLEGASLLHPGLEVDIEGIATVARAALLVSADAIALRDDRTGVFVVEGGRAVFRDVRTGYQTAEAVEILSGVREGELVVVRGKDRAVPGGRVRIVSTARP